MRQLRIALCLVVALLRAGALYAQEFPVTDKDGNILYFRVLDAEKRTSELIQQPGQGVSKYVLPSGTLTIPKAVRHDGIQYLVVSIGKHAVAGAVNLKKVIFPSSIDKIDKGAFSGCISLEVIVLPGHNIKINSTAFFDCLSLRDIRFGSDWTFIDCNPFSYSENLYYLSIPGKVSTILGLNELKRLKGITIDENNETFSSVDGILYNKVGSELLYCPIDYGKTLYVPEGVVSIRRGSLNRCIWMEEIHIPSSIRYLSYDEFDEMRNLSKLYFYSESIISTATYNNENVFALKVCERTQLYVPRNALKNYRFAITSTDGLFQSIDGRAQSLCKSGCLIPARRIKPFNASRKHV